MTGDTTRQYRTPGGGTLGLDQRLNQIEDKIDAILEEKLKMAVGFARVKDTVNFHHNILMAISGAAGLALIGAVLKLIIKGQ